MTNKFMLSALFALLLSAPALAQESPAAFDSRWTPYLGCWTIVQDQRQPAPLPAGTMVCVQPSGRFGVAVTTTVDGRNVLEQTIVADGSAQPLSQADCKGTQNSNWSRDGERLFTNVELECANRPKRTISGITLLAKGQWIDAQSTLIDGNSDVRLRRYRRTSDQYAAAPGMTTAPLTIDDVIEASAKVQPEALEAALDELNTRLALNSSALKQLADNGVSPNVIDLLIAQAYPDKFEVERSGYPSASSTNYGTTSMGSSTVYMGSAMYSSPMYDPFYSSHYYYSPFAYPYYWGPSYSYGYGSPFYRNYYNYNNYNNYGFGGGGYYGGPSFPSGGGNAQPGSPDSRGGDGVVVNGRGYTRVRPAGSTNSTGSGEGATPTSRPSGSSRGVRITGSSDSGASSSSSPSSSSGSSSSGASSGGYSGGGGGDSGGGRTAQPR